MEKDFFNYFKMMEPMKYYDAQDLSNPKAQKMVNSDGAHYVATKKYDGEWAMFIKGLNGEILIRSRSLSVVTGEYGDKTESLPHLVNEMSEFPNGTVLLGELCFSNPKLTSKDVGAILRCLAPKAIERQRANPLSVRVFDLLAYDGEILVDKPYRDRFYQVDFFMKNLTMFSNKPRFFLLTEYRYSDFMEFSKEVWSDGGEGIVIHSFNYKYQPGKRTAWDTLKIKKQLGELEVTVIGLVTPTHIYDGKSLATWPFWAYKDELGNEKKIYRDNLSVDIKILAPTAYPVTKYWYHAWAAGIVVKRNGVEISVASGLTDEDRAWLVTDEASKLILGGQLTAVISAMEETEDGSLRHPILIRLRTDA
jgi:hypothetical protein